MTRFSPRSGTRSADRSEGNELQHRDPAELRGMPLEQPARQLEGHAYRRKLLFRIARVGQPRVQQRNRLRQLWPGQMMIHHNDVDPERARVRASFESRDGHNPQR